MIFYKTSIQEIPNSCQECTMINCTLPVKSNQMGPQIMKAYKTKRHPKCPLIEIEILGDTDIFE